MNDNGVSVLAISQCRTANDYLAAAVARSPSRFADLATLPMGEPKEAALELERGVREHWLKIITKAVTTMPSSSGPCLRCQRSLTLRYIFIQRFLKAT